MIDICALKALAGGSVFKRGRRFFERQCVNDVSSTGSSVFAQVSDDADYAVELTLEPSLDGFCNCADSTNGGFCAHSVAVGLAWLDGSESEQASSQLQLQLEPLPEHESDLHAWLSGWDKSALLDALIETIEADPELEKRWALQRQVARSGDSIDRLYGLIDESLPEEKLGQYDEVKRYFELADSGIEALLRQCACLPAEPAFSLMFSAIKRLNRVLEHIDDSYGARFYIEGQLNLQLETLFAELDWPALQKAVWIAEQMMQEYPVFPDLPYAFIHNDNDVADAFYQLCHARIESMRPLASGVHAEQKSQMARFITPLIAQAEQSGDLATEIRLRTKLATEHFDFIRLSKLALKYGSEVDARQWLNRAQQEASAQRELQECLSLAIVIEHSVGNHEQALVLGWSRLQRWTALEHYKSLLELLGSAAETELEVYSRAERLFLAEAERQQQQGIFQQSQLLEFYFHHQQFDKAFEWSEGRDISDRQLHLLAFGLFNDHPQRSIQCYQQLIMRLVKQTDSCAYHLAFDHLLELRTRIRNLAATDPVRSNELLRVFQDHIVECQIQHRRKTSFIALLDDKRLI